jgi:hypothetical protein
MGRERSVLLRRVSPFAAVLVLLAPAAGRAASFSPDPPPGANELRPDPAPSLHPQVAAAVVRAAPVRTVTAPVPLRVATAPVPARVAPRSRRRPVERAQSQTSRLALPRLELPPVLVPAFIPASLRPRPPAGLAALALALAALTAGSGAGLVRAWSRR